MDEAKPAKPMTELERELVGKGYVPTTTLGGSTWDRPSSLMDWPTVALLVAVLAFVIALVKL